MRLPVAAAVAACLLVAGCSSGDDRACAAEVRERLDPGSELHVLPGGEVPPYESNPPTSGAHRVGRFPTGALDEPIEAPVQVTLLEGGEVLLQHDGLDDEERRALEQLASDHDDVTVAPNPDLAGSARVVATAWTYRQVCREVDVDTLGRFVEAHAGKGAGP